MLTFEREWWLCDQYKKRKIYFIIFKCVYKYPPTHMIPSDLTCIALHYTHLRRLCAHSYTLLPIHTRYVLFKKKLILGQNYPDTISNTKHLFILAQSEGMNLVWGNSPAILSLFLSTAYFSYVRPLLVKR